ncbi:hypothetical protein A2U01_0069804, partial [Trifolium medium]|nr:hypothetical protein [Trifolium medium]
SPSISVCKSARHSGTDLSALCPLLGSGVDSRAERARCYLFFVRCVWLHDVVFPDITTVHEASAARRSTEAV